MKAWVAEFDRCIYIIRKDRNPGIAPDVFEYLCGGRTAVDKNNVTIFDQRCSQLTYQFLFFRMILRALLLCLFKDNTLIQNRTPMCAFEKPFLFEPFQVAANCSFRCFKQIHQIGGTCDLMNSKKLLNLLSALGWNEGFTHLTDYIRI